MQPEFIILFLILIICIAFYFKEDIKEHFIGLEGVTGENPQLTTEQVEKMDDTIDNTDEVNRYLNGNVTDQTGEDHLNKIFPGRPTTTARDLYSFDINPIYITRDDRLANDGYKRSQKNRDAILGAVRTGKDISKRIVEEELQENERRQWYEDTLQDITIDNPKWFIPDWKLPDTKSGRIRNPKF